MHAGNYRVRIDVQSRAEPARRSASELSFDLPGGINKHKLGPVEFQRTVILILADEFYARALVPGAEIVFKVDPAIVQLGNDGIAIPRFIVGGENHSIAGVELRFHAVPLNNDRESVAIFA